MWKIMCWDSVDPRLNFFDIETFEEAEKMLKHLEELYPKYTFTIYEMEGEKQVSLITAEEARKQTVLDCGQKIQARIKRIETKYADTIKLITEKIAEACAIGEYWTTCVAKLDYVEATEIKWLLEQCGYKISGRVGVDTTFIIGWADNDSN